MAAPGTLVGLAACTRVIYWRTTELRVLLPFAPLPPPCWRVRSMRLVPHDQDTGGFFICLLRKTTVLAGGCMRWEFARKGTLSLCAKECACGWAR